MVMVGAALAPGGPFSLDNVNAQRLTLPRLLPVNRRAQRGQRSQIWRRVVTDQIDRVCAEQDKRRSDGDDGSADHGAAPFILARLDKKSELRNVSWLALF
jgi:hypothetical protein